MTRILVIVGFLIAFAAGLVVGLDPRHEKESRRSERSGRHGGWLAAKLELTPQQQEQLREIWSETARRGGRERDEERRRLLRERDAAIASLIPPDKEDQYQEILQDYVERSRALDREWRDSFEAAVERTRQILTPEQRAKYEELLQQSDRRPGEWRRGGQHRGPGRHDTRVSDLENS